MKRIAVVLLVCLMAAGICFAQGVIESTNLQEKTLPKVSAKELVKGLNEENPYFPPVSGLANEMSAGGAVYSVYVPEGQYPWAPGVIILTPNNMTSEEFVNSPLGLEWVRCADENKFSFGIVQPENGVWNIDGKSGRDEVEAILNVYTQMRSKSLTLNLPFTMDKSRVTLVGYGEGAPAAILAASGESAAYCAVAAIDSTGSDAAFLETLDSSYCFPFPADGLKGQEEIKLENGALKMPIWFIGETDEAAFEYYKTKNAVDSITYTSDAVRYYDSNDMVSSVFVTRDSAVISVEKLWSEFLSRYTRPLGVVGGHLAYAMNFETREDGTGYRLTEEVYDGFLRRYITYVPASYNPEKASPLVLVCHGYTATMYALAEESRWCDVAEENNLIVVFPQAFPNVVSYLPNIPAPAWMTPNLFPGGEGNTDDMAFLSHVIDSTKKYYSIDEGRVYGTGHSNGCAMTLALASENPELFTAIAPIGYATAGSGKKDGTILPTWLIMGEFDGNGYSLEAGTGNDKSIDYWTDFNGLDKSSFSDSVTENGRFNIRTWNCASGAPLLKFAGVNRSAHSYFPEESRMIWDEFFSKYSKENGVLYFEGEAVR